MLVEPERQDEKDDRVVCRMDVEGMPPRGIMGNLIHPRGKQPAAWPTSHPGQLTRSEAQKYIQYSVLAGLAIVLVYSVVLVLFVLFCINIWLR